MNSKRPSRRDRGTTAAAIVTAFAACAASVAIGSAAGQDAPPRQGGELEIVRTSAPDYLDPALAYTVSSIEPLAHVYTPLLTYRRVEGEGASELIPGLAEALPEVSDDGRTYRLRLRPGLAYSDGRPVRAGDFEHQIKRVLRLESGASGYFTGIVGARRYLAAKRPSADIAGITADEATGQITIRLEARDVTFPYVLALGFATLVPADTPFRDMSAAPPVGVGPFRLVVTDPKRRFALERNAGFSLPGVPSARLDRIVIRLDPNATRATRAVLSGRADALFDFPAPGLLGRIRARHRDRYREDIAPVSGYTYLNVRTPPFDKRAVRRALALAIDERVLGRLGGSLSTPACNFLPPSMVGYRRLAPCPYGDPAGPGDIRTARRLVRAAGAAGTEVTVWAPAEDPVPAMARYHVAVLNRIGLRGRLRLLPFDQFFDQIGKVSTRAQLGITAWVADFPHPLNFLFLLDGTTIQAANNTNYGLVDDPLITAGIARLRQQPDLRRAAAGWAALDRRAVEEAYVVGLTAQKVTALYSARVDVARCSVVHPVLLNDYAQLCLK